MVEREVKEAIYIRALNPSLNTECGKYNLPPVWDFGLESEGRQAKKGGGVAWGGGTCYNQHAQLRQQHWWDNRLMKPTGVSESIFVSDNCFIL